MIKSRFYLIRGDGEPIYVGFTNRPIKQRFAEHKAEKDFSKYEKVTVEEIDRLDYSFTWNEDILYKNANEVSIREAQLIVEYGTQESKYQKAIGGGQVWTYEKWFVKTNRNNPKFVGLSGSEIDEYIELKNSRLRKLRNYISSTIPPYLRKQKDYIHDTIPPYLKKQNSYISNTMPTYLRKQNGYIGNTIPSHLTKQKSYVSDTISNDLITQKTYIKNTIPNYLKKQKNYIVRTIPKYLTKQKHYIDSTIPNYFKKQKNYICNTRS